MIRIKDRLRTTGRFLHMKISFWGIREEVLRHDVLETNPTVSGLPKVSTVLFAPIHSYHFIAIIHSVRDVFLKSGSRNRSIV